MTTAGQVFLFSGHMIDAAGRKSPRFPPEHEDVAARVIAESLADMRPGDLGLCQGACGGDILFAEATLARGGALELRLPFDVPIFLRGSVAFEKAPSPVLDRWATRFATVGEHPATRTLVMTEVLGPTPIGISPYERCNQWMLVDALALAAGHLHFICLWDGRGGDGPGGTRHLVDEVRRNGGELRWLDTTKLWSS